MAFKNLSTETMVELSGALVDARRERPTLEKVPLLKAFLAHVDATHTQLCCWTREFAWI